MQREAESATVHQLKVREREVERTMEEKERQLVSLIEERERDGRQLEEVKRSS